MFGHFRMHTSFMQRVNLCSKTNCIKSRQICVISRTNFSTNFRAKTDKHDSCPSSTQLKPNSCVSLRLSGIHNVEYLQKEITKFFKPYLQNLEKSNEDNRAQTLVILATPTHIAWLENNSVRNYIGQLFKDYSCNSSTEVDVTCACVDGLAPSSEEIRCGRSTNIYEGVSVLMGTSTSESSCLWPIPSSQYARTDDECSLTFQHDLSNESDCSYRVTIPLSNTMFRNGRRSTLSVSKWQISKRGIYQIEGPVFRLHASTRICTSKNEYSLRISAKSLTEPRIIEKGFGNIVRSLKCNRQSSFPASHELEKAVTEAHRINAKHTNQGVWAMIIPSIILDKNKKIDYPISINSNNKQDLDSLYVESLIKKGAKICRVLGGGGGWGAKEGLLALDPKTSFGDTNEQNDSFILENQEMIFGNMAQEGSLIQFLQTADRCKLELASLRNEIKGAEIVIGCQPTDTSELTSVESPGHVYIPGLFGCISGTGIFLKFPGVEFTKIDMPNSFVHAR